MTNQNIPPKPLLVIVGPTASGKTSLAVTLAKQLGGEVVSADSMQIYCDLFIGTARPTEEEMDGVPHHLIGFLPLSERYSVAQYAAVAREVIADIHARGKLPILCGGTGLYVQAVTENLAFSEEVGDMALREQLRAEIAEKGGEQLLARLAALDPETAARLHSNDHGRIVRALEVVQSTGVPMSEWVRRSKANPPPYDTRTLVLNFRNRSTLYNRINKRVDSMLENGLLAEAKAVLASPSAPTAMQAIGYKELKPYFDGVCTLEAAVAQLKQETRRYAKRQMSWFRRLQDAAVLNVDECEDAVSAARTLLNL